MSRLRESALGAGRGAALPVLSLERLFAVEHVAARLDRRPGSSARSMSVLALKPAEIGALSPRELRRALGEMWSEIVPSGLRAAILKTAIERCGRSCDRAIIESYFMRYPANHADFALLCDAAKTAAERHSWHWRAVGRQYRLWDADAVDRCGADLRASGQPDAFLRTIGLVGKLAEGAFATSLAN
jgi:hypothetical protein